jgi:hypothetical protein
LVSVLKAGTASTLDVVAGIRKVLPCAALTLPPQLKITPLADQSLFVRSAISGVVREAVIAAALTGVMILLFIGSWRSTLIIAISIPLSILSSILVLSFLHETINIMTLGGLALAIGILVDDATVEIEKHQPHPRRRSRDRDSAGHPGWRPADRRTCTRLDPVHLHRLYAVVSPWRSSTISVRSAGGGGGLSDARFLHSFENPGADVGDVHAQTQ